MAIIKCNGCKKYLNHIHHQNRVFKNIQGQLFAWRLYAGFITLIFIILTFK